jgi:hypothetical protein
MHKRTKTKKQLADISRANGAKSKGPVTPEGKAVSARNAWKHGLRARPVMLTDLESDEVYNSIYDGLAAHFHPETCPEIDLVEQMALARFLSYRYSDIEAGLIGNEFDWHAETAKTDRELLVKSFTSGAYRPSSSLLLRHLARIDRLYSRSLKALLDLQARRAAQSAEPPANGTSV